MQTAPAQGADDVAEMRDHGPDGPHVRVGDDRRPRVGCGVGVALGLHRHGGARAACHRHDAVADDAVVVHQGSGTRSPCRPRTTSGRWVLHHDRDVTGVDPRGHRCRSASSWCGSRTRAGRRRGRRRPRRPPAGAGRPARAPGAEGVVTATAGRGRPAVLSRRHAPARQGGADRGARVLPLMGAPDGVVRRAGPSGRGASVLTGWAPRVQGLARCRAALRCRRRRT